MKNIKNRIKNVDKYYLYIAVVALFVLLPLISCKYFNGDDTAYHAASIIGMSKSNLFNIFNLKIFDYIAGSFGYGEGLFYAQLPHYISSIIFIIIKPFGLDVVASMKITHFICIFLSGIFMYKLMLNITEKNKNISFITAIFYMTIPYFISDIFVRDAFQEQFVFTFLPILFIGINELINKNYRKFYPNFIIGCLGLIYSHLVLTLYIAIEIFVVTLFSFKKVYTKENFKALLKALIIVIIFSLPFIAPMLENKLNTDYLVFQKGVMANSNTLNSGRLDIYDFFAIKDERLSIFSNFIVLLFAFYSIIKVKTIKKEKNKFMLYSSIILVILNFLLMSKLVNWEKMPYFLCMIQFTCRLQILFGFATCILAGLALTKFNVKDIKTTLLICLISCIFCTLYIQNKQTYQSYNVYDVKDNESYLNTYKDYLGTTEIPEKFDLSEYTKVYREYYTMNTFYNIGYLKDRNQELKIVDGKADISNYKNQKNISFKIKNIENATIELPKLYYLGYTITERLENGKKINIKYTENKNGFIEIKLTKNGYVEMKYTGTIINRICNSLCIIVSLILIFYYIKKIKKSS